MHRQSQRQTGCGSKSAYGGTDWQALEVQLTRTRTILQEILVHLQDVLRNLKMARAPGRPAAGAARPEAGRFGGQARTAESRYRAQTTPPPHGARPQAGAASGSNGTSATAGQTGSDYFRARPRPGFEARTETRQQGRPAGATGSEHGQSRPGAASGEKARSGESWSYKSGTNSSRTTASAGAGSRERVRTESTFRARTGAAGTERDAWRSHAAGQKTGAFTGSGASGTAGQTTAGQGRPHARTASRTASAFRMDRDRQHQAREAARKSGMNLKCAYDILCLDYPCTVDEIKNAYRHMARLHHPDLGGDEEAMKDVNVAYELAMRFCAGPRRTNAAWAV
jgi:hypothetical protein